MEQKITINFKTAKYTLMLAFVSFTSMATLAGLFKTLFIASSIDFSIIFGIGGVSK